MKKRLKDVLDGNDTYVSGGHQIVKARTYKRIVPAWALSDKKVRQLLLRSFPNFAYKSTSA